MIASREQLDNLLLREHVAYLERVVAILQPALEARLSAPVVLDQAPPEPVETVQEPEPASRPLSAPAARQLPPARPARAKSARTPSVNFGERVVAVIRESGGEIVRTADLTRRVYGNDREGSRRRLIEDVRPYREQGVVESVRGHGGGYRWIGGKSSGSVPLQTAPRPVPAVTVTVPAEDEAPATDESWSPTNGICWHVAGQCADYTRGSFCGHCTDQDGGVICPKRHRKEQPHERVYA